MHLLNIQTDLRAQAKLIAQHADDSTCVYVGEPAAPTRVINATHNHVITAGMILRWLIFSNTLDSIRSRFF